MFSESLQRGIHVRTPSTASTDTMQLVQMKDTTINTGTRRRLSQTTESCVLAQAIIESYNTNGVPVRESQNCLIWG